jgi:hypothetical protein
VIRLVKERIPRVNAEQLIGIVKLRDGGTSELNLNKTRETCGQTKYGTFQIRMADLKKLMIRTAAHRQFWFQIKDEIKAVRKRRRRRIQ